MTPPAALPRIQLEHRRYDSFPVALDTVMPDDRYVLIAALKSAQCKVISGGQTVFEGESRPGMLRINEPGERVRVFLSSPAEHICITIPAIQMRSIRERFDCVRRFSSSRIGPLAGPDHRVLRAAKASFAIKDFEDNQKQLYVEGLTYSMLACFLTGQTRTVHPCLRSRNQALSDVEFDRCCQYADAMMDKKLDLHAWAGILGMSSIAFTKRFERITQQSPYAWFLDRRIGHAKKLLQDRRHSIVAVSLAVGFCGQSHFTEAFRRRVGCSPGRWRAESTQSAV